jgi:type I restriction enzyme S subunit
LLLTITGANVGKAARVEADLDEAYVSQHVALIRGVEADIAEFLHLFFTADAGARGQLNKKAYGAGKPGLNLQQVAAVSVPLAGVLEIRALLKALTDQMEAATANESAITVALNQSSAQRQNILRAAFAGQLVRNRPPHPIYSPAPRCDFMAAC